MYALMEHEVKNYSVWKKHFDANKSMLKKSGAVGKEVIYKNIDNPNKLIIGMGWDNKKNFEKTINSEEIKQLMQEAGVIKVPSITFYESTGHKDTSCACQVMMDK